VNWAIVLAGGVGSRFWPLSTPDVPKQLLPLVGEDPLLVETVRRLDGLVPPTQIVIVTGAGLVGAIRKLVPAIPASHILAEPRAASTAPALVWATTHIARDDPDAVVLSLHADWAVAPADAFRATARRALDLAAREDVLVTVGVPPTRPDPGLGYIVPGDPVDGVHRVRRFVEKPAPELAAELIARGALWNSGLFAWTAARLVAEVHAHARELHTALPALERGDILGFFTAATPVSIDTGVLERSERVAVLRAGFEWDDVGTWAALARVNPTDAAGNFRHGPAAFVNAASCVVWAGDQPIVLAGVESLVVVQANGLTLVASREAADDLKHVLAQLPADLRGPA